MALQMTKSTGDTQSLRYKLNIGPSDLQLHIQKRRGGGDDKVNRGRKKKEQIVFNTYPNGYLSSSTRTGISIVGEIQVSNGTLGG